MVSTKGKDAVVYRDFVLSGIMTERFNQRLVMNDADIESLYHEFNIQVSCLVHADDDLWHGVQSAPVGWGGLGTIAKMQTIQHYLMQPQGVFEYWSGGQRLIQVTPVPAQTIITPIQNAQPCRYNSESTQLYYLDAAGGPKPTDCDISMVDGGNVLQIRFTIKFNVRLCGAPSQNFPNPGYAALADGEVLNHSWSYTEEMGPNMWWSRNLEGVVKVAHPGYWPHVKRYLVVPSLMEGYKREAQRFVQSKDQLTLEYSIQDVQRYAAPPAPAVDWRCRHSEDLQLAASEKIQQRSNFSVTLIGDPSADKRHLIKSAYDVIRAKMQFDNLGKPAEAGERTVTVIPVSFQIVDDMHENTISMNASFMRAVERAELNTIMNVMVNTTNMGYPLPSIASTNLEGYKPRIWPQPALFDSDNPIGTFARYLQSMCSPYHGIPNNVDLDQNTTGTLVTRPAHVRQGQHPQQYPAVPGKYVTDQPLQPNDYDPKNAVNLGQDTNNVQAYPVTHFDCDTKYDIDRGLVVLPKAARIAQTNDQVEMFNFGAEVCIVTISMRGQRRGDWPQMPAIPRTTTDPATGITMRLMSNKWITETPKMEQGSRTFIYTSHATIVYAMSRPPTDTEKLAVGLNTGYVEISTVGMSYNLGKSLTSAIYNRQSQSQ